MFNPDTDIPDLSGQVILVTGGNAGLGYQTILQLAKHHPSKIYLAARSETKARDAITTIHQQLGDTSASVDIQHLPLDTSSLGSVKAAAETVLATTQRLDVLVLNAGIMAVPPSKTVDGFEIQMGTNHVGHFLLTKLLMPLLQTTARELDGDVRVISVSSDGHRFAPARDVMLSTDKLCEQGPWACYGASKAANIVLAAELARRYPDVLSMSLHPGQSDTGLFSQAKQSWWVSILMTVFKPLLFSGPQTVALNQIYLARGMKREDAANGGYYHPVGKLKTGNEFQSDETFGKELWEWTERELASRGY